MSPTEFESILKVGEHICVEFKAARNGAEDDVFEINEGINKIVLQAIQEHPGVTAPAIAQLVGKSLATVERAVSALTSHRWLEHRGSKKTGGYYAVMPTNS